MNRLAGKVVAVTGASSGIGLSLSRMLAERGAIPVLLARRADKLKEVSSSINGQHLVIQTDVTDTGQVELAVSRMMEQFGRIDVWVNNAGFGLFEPFLEMPLTKFADMLDVNYLSIVRCCQSVLPHMLKAGSGHIVNVASVAGKVGTAKSVGYSASKHAVIGLTTSLRAELAGTGVVVSSVNPGPIDTEFFDIADPHGTYKKNVQWLLLPPERVANAICRVIASGKADVTLPWSASIGAKLMQLFPNALSGISAKLLNRK